MSSNIFQRGKQPFGQVVPEMPVISWQEYGKWKGWDTPRTIYTPGSLKPARKNSEIGFYPKFSIYELLKSEESCPSTGSVDKITPSNVPIIFRLLKIVFKKIHCGTGKRACPSRTSLAPAHPCWAVSIPACPTLSHSPPLWASTCWIFAHPLWSCSTASSTWRLPCFPYLELVANSSLFSKHSVYYQDLPHSLYHNTLCCVLMNLSSPCCWNKWMLDPILQKWQWALKMFSTLPRATQIDELCWV